MLFFYFMLPLGMDSHYSNSLKIIAASNWCGFCRWTKPHVPKLSSLLPTGKSEEPGNVLSCRMVRGGSSWIIRCTTLLFTIGARRDG